MAVNVYINFNGNCREAIEFYAEVFETEKPKIMTFGDAPANPEYPVTEDIKDLIMNASLNINGSNMMFADVPHFMTLNVGNNISLIIINNSIDKIKSLFSKLKEDGTVDMELGETFWSKCYGSLTDKFGIAWQLSYDPKEK